MTFEITGFTIELDQEGIDELGGDVTKALEIVGQVGEASAKEHAPVDTGNLRRSITHELGERGLGQFVRIGTNVEYAIYQEVGTRFHPAHPFLRPAMEAVGQFIGGATA